MGSYCKFLLNCDLKLDTPQWVVDILKYMIRTAEYEFPVSSQPFYVEPEAESGKTFNWWEQDWLRNKYRANFAVLHSRSLSFIDPSRSAAFQHLLFIQTTLHNEDWGLIRPFLEWLAPYVETKGSVGLLVKEGRGDIIPLMFGYEDEVEIELVSRNEVRVKRLEDSDIFSWQ